MTDAHDSDRMNASGQLQRLGRRLDGREGSIQIGEIVDHLGSAGIGMTLLLMSLPALIPIPGPIGVVFGSIVAIISLQLIFGARRLFLPQFVRKRSLPATGVKAMIDKGLPILQRAEGYLKPRRLLPLTGRTGRMALAIPLVMMGVAVALPVPTGNVPPVASLIALSLGLVMRDGVAILVGLALAVFAIGWFVLLFFLGAQMLEWLWSVLGWN